MCPECTTATEYHSSTLFNPLCKWCGARLVQLLGTLPVSAVQIKARRKAVLDDWEKFGHDRTEMRNLALGALAIEGQALAKEDPLKKRKGRKHG